MRSVCSADPRRRRSNNGRTTYVRIPVALATGVGTDSQRPFALVIVSGLFTRLLISVFSMPALYTLVERPGDRLEV